ncbi:MAG: hypothetical protein R3A44_36855 [Caldilineaceae bacterium]
MYKQPSTRVVLARHESAEGEIQLQQRLWPDGALAFEIIANGVFLMASYNQTSERALASRTLDALEPELYADLPVLVGGLGMGFTLQAVLENEVAAVEVVEMSAHIIEWNRTHFAPLNGHALANPRVTLIQDDLYDVHIALDEGKYAAILLDVDNGPSWLVHEDNARLYTEDALRQWSNALAPGGALAVWSAQREAAFLRAMTTVFDCSEEIAIEAPVSHGRDAEFFIYCGVKTL